MGNIPGRHKLRDIKSRSVVQKFHIRLPGIRESARLKNCSQDKGGLKAQCQTSLRRLCEANSLLTIWGAGVHFIETRAAYAS
jgi:hypothetical protein